MPAELCRVYWGTHGCALPRGHEDDCLCVCADVPAEDGGVGKPPYYGLATRFYGEDAAARGLPVMDLPER